MLLLAWLIVIVSFFILSVQLFVTLIEFKLVTLAGFVIIPFALWNKTAFLAERVLGAVVSAGIKVLVLAVIAGIGAGMFAQFNWLLQVLCLRSRNALALMLAALALLGLGIFGPGIATGLIGRCPAIGCGGSRRVGDRGRKRARGKRSRSRGRCASGERGRRPKATSLAGRGAGPTAKRGLATWAAANPPPISPVTTSDAPWGPRAQVHCQRIRHRLGERANPSALTSAADPTESAPCLGA